MTCKVGSSIPHQTKAMQGTFIKSFVLVMRLLFLARRLSCIFVSDRDGRPEHCPPPLPSISMLICHAVQFTITTSTSVIVKSSPVTSSMSPVPSTREIHVTNIVLFNVTFRPANELATLTFPLMSRCRVNHGSSSFIYACHVNIRLHIDQ
jgi:hypothetical protein